MTNVNQTVWKILQSDLAIQKDLAREIVNMRALAKYILKKHDLHVSLDAVISAIRRFQSQETFQEEDTLLLKTLKDSLISTKNNVSCITIHYNSPACFGRICKIAENNKTVRMVVGSREIKLFMENRDVSDAKLLLSKEDHHVVKTGLAQISVVTSDNVANVRGVAARITSEISLASININELLVCQPEFIIYIKEEDTVKAHNSLLKLCGGIESL